MYKIILSQLSFIALLLLGSMSLANAQTVKGRIWNDTNKNGLQDAGEMGLANVYVQIFKNNTPGLVKQTAADGTYSFSVNAGSSFYITSGGAPSGFEPTTANVGNNDAIDSDINASGHSAVFNVAAGQTVTIDGGYSSLLGTNTSCASVTATLLPYRRIEVAGITAQYSKILILGPTGEAYSRFFISTPPGGKDVSVTLPAGTYSVKVTFMNQNFTATCVKNLSVTVSGEDEPLPNPLPTLSINDVTVNEAAGNATLKICANKVSTAPMNVRYTAANGTANSGSDYIATTLMVTIPQGLTCVNITVPIKNDDIHEGTEVFDVNLTNPTGATIADNQGKVTIMDNDPVVPVVTPCTAVTIGAGANNTIVFTGVNTQYSKVKVLNGLYAPVFSKLYTSAPGTVTVPTLPNGTYSASVILLNSNFQEICTKAVVVTIGGNQNAIASNAALTFNATRQESAAQLKWVSNSGDINDYFVIERSADENEWSEIALVDGRGNAGELLQFSQLDTEAAKGDNYYRIRQVLQDGSINYSQIEKVFIPNSKSFGLYPNPASVEVFVETAAFEGQSVTVLVHNQLGKVVKTIEVAEATDAVQIALDGMENGFYTVTAISKGVQRASKLVIHKAE